MKSVRKDHFLLETPFCTTSTFSFCQWKYFYTILCWKLLFAKCSPFRVQQCVLHQVSSKKKRAVENHVYDLIVLSCGVIMLKYAITKGFGWKLCWKSFLFKNCFLHQVYVEDQFVFCKVGFLPFCAESLSPKCLASLRYVHLL